MPVREPVVVAHPLGQAARVGLLELVCGRVDDRLVALAVADVAADDVGHDIDMAVLVEVDPDAATVALLDEVLVVVPQEGRAGLRQVPPRLPALDLLEVEQDVAVEVLVADGLDNRAVRPRPRLDVALEVWTDHAIGVEDADDRINLHVEFVEPRLVEVDRVRHERVEVVEQFHSITRARPYAPSVRS